MQAPDLPRSASFPWEETGRHVREAQSAGALVPDSTGRWYEQRGEDGVLRAALRPPLVLLTGDGLPESAALCERAEEGPGRYAVLLLQAGAAALGLYDDDELLDHKALKRYVVRGTGRAQPSHLKTRGKSRYGSRLRLRNAQRLLEDVSRRLGAWFVEDPAPERLYTSCPVRLFADFCRVDPLPPVGGDDPRRVRIPLDVNVPTHAELVRVRRSMGRGRIWTI